MYYEIIDNVLTKSEHEKIKSTLFSGSFPWYIRKSISSNSFSKNLKEKNDFYFFHVLFEDFTVRSQHIDLVVPLIKTLNVRSLTRIKCNFYSNTDSLIYHDKHVDDEFEHFGAIYYVNDNDGYTIMEDGTKIESVANRLLKFEPWKPHSSTNCTDQIGRVNINFNYF